MKRILCFILCFIIIFSLCGCENNNRSGTAPKGIAIIRMPDDSVISIEMKDYIMYSTATVTIIGMDGTKYRVHMINCFMEVY